MSTRNLKPDRGVKITPALLTPRQAELSTITENNQRPSVRGKFVFIGEQKIYIKGVTYGAFRPNEEGIEFHDAERLDNDFAMMAAFGFNVVRIPHTVPPRKLLDIAGNHGLRVMVGLSAEQYVGYLIDRNKRPDIAGELRDRVGSVAGHPALLCYALGNEIPASLARWIGRKRLERYLGHLYDEVKDADPEGLVTYVNYPTTEYFDLPFLDLVCFNVYLEEKEKYSNYLSRLQNIAGDRPLVMSEVGLDALRNGEDTQAKALDWQTRIAFREGCAGVIVFSWTDEWYRGGGDVEDWAFGVTDRDRHPKPSLFRLSRALREVPFHARVSRPLVSVVVCTFNGSGTIRECLTHLKSLEYPSYEVVVVNDGSTDRTASIIDEFPFRHIKTANRGLSAARNTGWQEAQGDIVAYIDDDAYPDPCWLDYLAATFEADNYAAVGGPNLSPPEDNLIAQCVARAPGGPSHVLLTDTVAEHIPGCNMAIRRSCLEAIGGFDERLRVAGDDVDVCWRLQAGGWRVGFSPAAMVWHHRRSSVRAFWKQQVGYGRAEALLERKWPGKYSPAGHALWKGRIYGNGVAHTTSLTHRIFHGAWGGAPFQSLYRGPQVPFVSMTTSPEWYLAVALLGGLSILGVYWPPLLWTTPIFAISILAPIVQVCRSTAKALHPTRCSSSFATLYEFVAIGALHVIQPLARLLGRLTYGLSPWRSRPTNFCFPCPRRLFVWSEDSKEPHAWLDMLDDALRRNGSVVTHGGDFDCWDLEVRGGIFSSARLLMAAEDHGSGHQYIRFSWWPRFTKAGLVLACLLSVLSISAAADQAWTASAILGTGTGLLLWRILTDGSTAMEAIKSAITASISTDNDG